MVVELIIALYPDCEGKGEIKCLVSTTFHMHLIKTQKLLGVKHVTSTRPGNMGDDVKHTPVINITFISIVCR